MEKVVTVLLNRQRNGNVTLLRTLARSASSSPVKSLGDLVRASWEGLILLGRWPWGEVTTETALFALPLKPDLMLPNCSLEELMWPQLTNELLKGNFAAHIYLFHRLHKFTFTGKVPRNYNWQEQMEYLYRNLALSEFGISATWQKQQTFCIDWPSTPEQLAGITVLPSEPTLHRPRASKIGGVASGLPEVRPILSPDEATAKYPEGFVSVKDVVVKANTLKISTSKIVKAIGGDRGLGPVRNENWRQFLIGNQRYLSANVMEELPSMVAGYNNDPT